jgi:hypothetical protein
MAESTARFSTGLRPGYRRRRFFGLGNKGSINAHNLSSRIGVAVTTPPCAAKTVNHWGITT